MSPHNVTVQPPDWCVQGEVGTCSSHTETHQLLAVVLLRVRVQRLLSTGIAIMLLRGVQRQRGLVPAWQEEADTCVQFTATFSFGCCQTCVWPAVKCGGEKKSERKNHKKKEKQIIPEIPAWHDQLHNYYQKTLRLGRRACTSIFWTNKGIVAGKKSSISVCVATIFTKRDVERWDGRARTEKDGRVYSGETVGRHSQREPAGAGVPLHFVCKRLEVLNHLALLRWRGGGPASEGQEAIETQLVTQPAAAGANESHHCQRPSQMNNWPDRERMRLSASKLTTFEAEWRGIALPFRLVIGACGRSCRAGEKKRGQGWSLRQERNQDIDIQMEGRRKGQRTRGEKQIFSSE